MRQWQAVHSPWLSWPAQFWQFLPASVWWQPVCSSPCPVFCALWPVPAGHARVSCAPCEPCWVCMLTRRPQSHPWWSTTKITRRALRHGFYRALIADYNGHLQKELGSSSPKMVCPAEWTTDQSRSSQVPPHASVAKISGQMWVHQTVVARQRPGTEHGSSSCEHELPFA